MNRLLNVVLAMSAALALSACQAMQGSGPHMDNASSVSTQALPYDVVDLTPQSVVAYRAAALPKAPVAMVQPVPAHYVVGPEDVLKVHVVERYAGGIFATLQQPGTLVVTRRVTREGTIEVPFAGTLAVAGLDLRQIQAAIVARLAGKANDPQVMVELDSDRTNTITVSGAVAKPGTFSLLDGTQTLVEAINRAGGPLSLSPAAGGYGGGGGSPPADGGLVPNTTGTGSAGYGLSTGTDRTQVLAPPGKALSDASQMNVALRRQGRVILDKALASVLMGGDVALRAGDEIVVSPLSQVVTILGAVKRAGNLPITKPVMTLSDALGEASGLFDPAANTTGVFVFRAADNPSSSGNRSRIFRLDMLQPVSVFVAQQFVVLPRDVIYVTNAPLYEYDKALVPIYRTLYAVNAARSY
jgi:polysaccharide export outer membrane protein